MAAKKVEMPSDTSKKRVDETVKNEQEPVDCEAAWKAATKAEREACAELCANEANKQWEAYEKSPDSYVEGRSDSADYLARKIFSREEK